VRDKRHYLDNQGGFFDLMADPLQQKNLTGEVSDAAQAARQKLAQALAAMPPDAAPPFPEYVHAERLLEENKRANRARQLPGMK
jgi:hypothetical protein